MVAVDHGVSGKAYHYAIKKCTRMVAFVSMKALFIGVKVQSGVKISRTNLPALGVRGSVDEARDGNTKTRISKAADAESRESVQKDKGQIQVAMAKSGAQVSRVT